MDKAEDYRKITIYRLNEWGYIPKITDDFFHNSGILSWNSWKGEQTISLAVHKNEEDEALITFSYTIDNNETGIDEHVNYSFELIPSPCNLGGFRYWFKCHCGRRVGVLYLGKYLACRHCYNLTYESRTENRRSTFYPLGKYFKILKEIEKLPENITVFYNGKPTRKFKRMLKLCDKIKRYQNILDSR